MLTYKNIQILIEQFAENQPQIRNFHRGNPYDVDEIQQVDGAYMVWQIQSVIPNGNTAASWQMTLFFMSQVTEINDPSNSENVQNEAQLQANDFISFVDKYNYSQFTTDKDFVVQFDRTSWNIQLFEERFNSLYAGAMLTLGIIGGFDYNRCAIPVIPSTLLTEAGDTIISETGDTLITQ